MDSRQWTGSDDREFGEPIRDTLPICPRCQGSGKTLRWIDVTAEWCRETCSQCEGRLFVSQAEVDAARETESRNDAVSEETSRAASTILEPAITFTRHYAAQVRKGYR